MLPRIALLLLLATGPAIAGPAGEAGRYLEAGEYLQSVFPADMPEAKTLWVTGDVRAAVERMLDHKFASLRVRYWFDGMRSAWILDEIGRAFDAAINMGFGGEMDDRVDLLLSKQAVDQPGVAFLSFARAGAGKFDIRFSPSSSVMCGSVPTSGLTARSTA